MRSGKTPIEMESESSIGLAMCHMPRVPGVSYTVISTAYDEVVTPFTNTFLRSPGVRNILVQNVCPLDATDHLGITYDPIAIRLVLNQLDPSTASAPRCIFVAPLVR